MAGNDNRIMKLWRSSRLAHARYRVVVMFRGKERLLLPKPGVPHFPRLNASRLLTFITSFPSTRRTTASPPDIYAAASDRLHASPY